MAKRVEDFSFCIDETGIFAEATKIKIWRHLNIIEIQVLAQHKEN